MRCVNIRQLIKNSYYLHSSPLSFQTIHNLSSISNPFTGDPSNKVYPDCTTAILASGLKSGDILLCGGFGICGIPSKCIQSIHDLGYDKINNLTVVWGVVSNKCDIDDWGNVLENNQIKRLVTSYLGAPENALFADRYLNGLLEVEFVPQGTLAERLRAGGAGIPAFYTSTGYGTWVETGNIPIKYKEKSQQRKENEADNVALKSQAKHSKHFVNKLTGDSGRNYVLEEAIIGDVAIVKATQCDTFGNCKWKGSSMNFNPECASAARFTIVECEEIVPLGYLKPENIHLSGAFVDAIVQRNYPKRIERVTNSERDIIKSEEKQIDFIISNMDEREKKRYRIIKRAARELKEGMVVNLGIGLPRFIPNVLSENVSSKIWLQSETGILGVGPYPFEGEEDADLINPAKEAVTVIDGASIFSSCQAFSMICGGHVDVTMLGALEVSSGGDIANWIIPNGTFVRGMGGAMELVSCGATVIAILEHCDKNGKSKIKKRCEFPLSGMGVVSKIITDLCVFEVDLYAQKLILTELLDRSTLQQVKDSTECEFEISGNLQNIKILNL
eukprot:177818_1